MLLCRSFSRLNALSSRAATNFLQSEFQMQTSFSHPIFFRLHFTSGIIIFQKPFFTKALICTSLPWLWPYLGHICIITHPSNLLYFQPLHEIHLHLVYLQLCLIFTLALKLLYHPSYNKVADCTDEDTSY